MLGPLKILVSIWAGINPPFHSKREFSSFPHFNFQRKVASGATTVSSQNTRSLSLSLSLSRKRHGRKVNGSGEATHLSIAERETDISRLYHSLVAFFALSFRPCSRYPPFSPSSFPFVLFQIGVLGILVFRESLCQNFCIPGFESFLVSYTCTSQIV